MAQLGGPPDRGTVQHQDHQVDVDAVDGQDDGRAGEPRSPSTPGSPAARRPRPRSATANPGPSASAAIGSTTSTRPVGDPQRPCGDGSAVVAGDAEPPSPAVPGAVAAHGAPVDAAPACRHGASKGAVGAGASSRRPHGGRPPRNPPSRPSDRPAERAAGPGPSRRPRWRPRPGWGRPCPRRTAGVGWPASARSDGPDQTVARAPAGPTARPSGRTATATTVVPTGHTRSSARTARPMRASARTRRGRRRGRSTPGDRTPPERVSSGPDGPDQPTCRAPQLRAPPSESGSRSGPGHPVPRQPVTRVPRPPARTPRSASPTG